MIIINCQDKDRTQRDGSWKEMIMTDKILLLRDDMYSMCGEKKEEMELPALRIVLRQQFKHPVKYKKKKKKTDPCS